MNKTRLIKLAVSKLALLRPLVPSCCTDWLLIGTIFLSSPNQVVDKNLISEDFGGHCRCPPLSGVFSLLCPLPSLPFYSGGSVLVPNGPHLATNQGPSRTHLPVFLPPQHNDQVCRPGIAGLRRLTALAVKKSKTGSAKALDPGQPPCPLVFVYS